MQTQVNRYTPPKSVKAQVKLIRYRRKITTINLSASSIEEEVKHAFAKFFTEEEFAGRVRRSSSSSLIRADIFIVVAYDIDTGICSMTFTKERTQGCIPQSPQTWVTDGNIWQHRGFMEFSIGNKLDIIANEHASEYSIFTDTIGNMTANPDFTLEQHEDGTFVISAPIIFVAIDAVPKRFFSYY